VAVAADLQVGGYGARYVVTPRVDLKVDAYL